MGRSDLQIRPKWGSGRASRQLFRHGRQSRPQLGQPLLGLRQSRSDYGRAGGDLLVGAEFRRRLQRALVRGRRWQSPPTAHRDSHAHVLEPHAAHGPLIAASLAQALDLRESSAMLRKRLVFWLLAPIFAIVLASWSFSLALEGGWLRRSLSARLAATFGRPVEVAHFGFSIWGGPVFEADSVTVGEDPRFGQEYFLRADRLIARFRWSALLHGRMEFDRLSLSHPSLNLVRSSGGTWNIETWLPAASTQAPPQIYPSTAEVPPHPSPIQTDARRTNSTNGLENLPFALADVNGNVNLQIAARWPR